MKPPISPEEALDIQADVHETAKKKGWWDEPRSWNHCLMLVATEFAEAAEEYRRGYLLNAVRCQKCNDTTFCDHLSNKPEGFPVEIADAVIRLMDLAEAEGMRPDWWGGDVRDEVIGQDVLEGLYWLTRDSLMMETTEEWADLRAALWAFARTHGFDLTEVIRLKARFNESRPMRHGGKLA